MTSLRIQKLHIEDCEAAIRGSYYEWGRGWAGDSPEPDWAMATAEQRRDIALRGYALYDGLSPCHGNELEATEVYVSVGINSGVTLFDAIRFLRRSEEARPLLARIPDDARLEDGTDDQIEAAGALIELLAQESHIARGKATKVLHRKRPAFIPVIDSVVSNFLWRNFPHLLTEGSPNGLVLRVYKLLLVARAEPLNDIRVHLRDEGFTFTTARLLSHLVWLAWKPRRMDEVWGTHSVLEARRMAAALWGNNKAREHGQ
jgi:hypothetical protein